MPGLLHERRPEVVEGALMNRGVFLAGAATLFAAKPVPAFAESIPTDRPLDFTMEVLDGPSFHLIDYRGKVVVIDMFASWCGPCNRHQPAVDDLFAKYATQGLVAVGLNDEESDNAVRRYRERYSITYPIAIDHGGRLSSLFQNRDTSGEFDLPGFVFIDRSGCWDSVMQGFDQAQFEKIVMRLLASGNSQ